MAYCFISSTCTNLISIEIAYYHLTLNWQLLALEQSSGVIMTTDNHFVLLRRQSLGKNHSSWEKQSGMSKYWPTIQVSSCKINLFDVKFLLLFWASQVTQTVKNLPAVWETWFDPGAGKIPWRRAWAPHSSILAWRIPWTEEPGGLQSMGSQRAGHDWATHTTHTHVVVFRF